MNAARLAVTSSLAILAMIALPAAPALAAPPINDNYLSSLRILDATGALPTTFEDTQSTVEATTQADLFNPDLNGLPLGGGPVEPTRCGTTSYGNTVWYDFAPTVPGGVEITTAGFDAAIAVYEFDPTTARITRLVDCQNASAGVSEDFVVKSDVRAGRSYTVQVGGVVSPTATASGNLTFGFHFYADQDGDGTLDEEPDKCLRRPGIDAFGGCPPTLRVAPTYNYDAAPGGGIRLTVLKVLHMPAGGRLEARCRACKLKQVVKVRPGSTTVRLSRLIGKTLPAGSSLELYATRPKGGNGKYRYGAFGHYIRYVVRGGKLGSRRDRCLLPGKTTPLKTCR